jgi:hypothetical protein
MRSARLSRWHIGAIPAISDGVRSSRAVRKHCSLTNDKHAASQYPEEVQVPLLFRPSKLR